MFPHSSIRENFKGILQSSQTSEVLSLLSLPGSAISQHSPHPSALILAEPPCQAGCLELLLSFLDPLEPCALNLTSSVLATKPSPPDMASTTEAFYGPLDSVLIFLLQKRHTLCCRPALKGAYCLSSAEASVTVWPEAKATP